MGTGKDKNKNESADQCIDNTPRCPTSAKCRKNQHSPKKGKKQQ
jgi:hypothetical protein